MKKIIKLSLVLLTICTVCMMGRVYAVMSSNVNLTAPKSTVAKGEEFTIDANIANIQSDRGVITLSATLEYDKESLTLVKMEGLNGWSTPRAGGSYNTATGKIVIDRDAPGKANEAFLRLTFKVNDNSKQNLTVTLKDIATSDGNGLASVDQGVKNITVSSGTQNPTTPTVPDNKNNNVNNGTTTNTANNSNGSTTSNTNKTTTNRVQISKDVAKDKALPKTGENTIILVSAIAILVVGAVIFFIKMKKMSKKI